MKQPSNTYQQLFPLFADYWDKPLAELPIELQDSAKKAANPFEWDECGSEDRRRFVRNWDWHRDPALEAQTWHALFHYGSSEQDTLEHYLDASPLTLKIKEAETKDWHSVVVKLRAIQSKIAEILKENHERWDVTEPQLWKSIYLLSQNELKTLLSDAEANKDYCLERALKGVGNELERILNIDRERIGGDVTTQAAPKVEPLPAVTQAIVVQNKLRTNCLDPAIDKAINKASSMNLNAVYLELKELALGSEKPFTGEFDGDALCYTDDGNILAKLTKDALGKRLQRRKRR